MLIAAIAALTAQAKEVTLRGLKYELNSDGTATCVGLDRRGADYADVAARVTDRNKEYMVTRIGDMAFENCTGMSAVAIPEGVTQIGRRAFYGCVRIKEVELPASVKSIGYGAFEGCVALVKVRMPEEVKVEYYKKGHRRYSPFARCRKLNEINGINLKYPARFLEELITAYDDVPFVSRKEEIRDNSFSYYAASRIKTRMERWQEKREYESREEWEARMSDDNRRKKITEITEELREEFIRTKVPVNFITMLGEYDKEYGIFPVKTADFGQMYMKVPVDEAVAIKGNWKKVKVTPKYGIVDDQVAILSCSYSYNGKTYGNVKTFENDKGVALALEELDPISITLRNDEREQGEVAGRVVAENPNPQVGGKTPKVSVDDAIDKNIPRSKVKNSNTFAVIIGNENYEAAEKVPFAKNDAATFAQYCVLTLGIPAKNIIARTDVSLAGIRRTVRDIKNVAQAFSDREINVIFYYSGHGIPNEANHGAYLLPIDVDGTSTEDCYPLAKLYEELGSLKANVYMFIDACFSGSVRGDGMIVAARGTVIKPREEEPCGNTVVFTASSGNETAFPYAEKGHGMFTYFLLSKLRESVGDVTLGELGEYVRRRVSQEATLVNHKPQTPTVSVSEEMDGKWESLKLR